MIISKLSIKNFRCLKQLENVKISNITTLVGKNDSGKSSILHALDIFFNEQKIEDNDFFVKSSEEESIEITISFNNLPDEIELEEGIRTTFAEENLLNSEGEFEIIKTFSRSNPKKPKILLNIWDFQEEKFSNLCSKKETDLNNLFDILGIDFIRSGRSITNKDKRAQLRGHATNKNISKIMIKVEPSTDLYKRISNLLPKYSLFHADTSLSIEETSFQNEFKEIVLETVHKIENRTEIENEIRKGLQDEFSKILAKFRQYCVSIVGLTPDPQFSWDKLVKFDLKGVDEYKFEVSMEKRGSGTRRILMVAFFQYLVDRNMEEDETNFIYAIEEPEAFIHPGLQRELAMSFNDLVKKGYQIIITSHSPVFAGFSPKDKLLLLKMENGTTKILQEPQLNLDEVANELGVEPSDQIATFKACIFVEGKTELDYWKCFIEKLKASNKTDFNFKGKEIGIDIGLIPLGGCNNLKHYVDRKMLKRINKKFLVILDSDKKKKEDPIMWQKMDWKTECESEGGELIILKKREIENYLHPEALKRAGAPESKFVNFDIDYGDIKKDFGQYLERAVKEMTADEILERANENENGAMENEILQIVNKILSLV